MSIKKHWKDVYKSVVDVEHTGDTNWQTALNVTGKGKAEIHCGGNRTYDKSEFRFTLDGVVLQNGLVVGRSSGWVDLRFIVEWNKSCLVEYRVNNAAYIVYVDIIYYNN